VGGLSVARLAVLPRIMLAPNGARRTRADHPELPVTIAQTVATAAACHAAGAGALHAHVRDADGRHLLDAGAYSELIAEMARVVPGMPVQITTESVGIYSATQQRDLLRAIRPEGVSISIAEMLSDGDRAAARRCYHELSEQGVAVQHICYSDAELSLLADERAAGTIPPGPLTLLFTLGRYVAGQASDPTMLAPFLAMLAARRIVADWAVCAFGPGETRCLAAAFAAGGKARVGFENSLWMDDGTLAPDNAARVRQIAALPGATPGDLSPA
jgi:3-keto-5-aminohexanoate cleavage enzyme